MIPRLKYFLTSLGLTLLRARVCCPSCGSDAGELVARKYAVTTLRRCSQCRLLFRAPTTSANRQAVFYQRDYRQGFTTDLPGEELLKRYLDAEFRGTEKDYSPYLRVLDAIGANKGQALFDLGCSWGYGS